MGSLFDRFIVVTKEQPLIKMRLSFEGAKNELKMYSPGDVVAFDHLKNSKHLNGKCGVVISYLPDNGRYEVRPVKSRGSVYVKPTNLTQKNIVTIENIQSKRKCLISAAFWPDVYCYIPVQALLDWPTDWTKEMKYLRSTHNWKQPYVMSGIRSRNSAKPDFVVYFDAGDKDSPINHAAETILANLPSWEQSKVRSGCGESIRIHGVCILCYDPTQVEIGFVSENNNIPLPPPDNNQNEDKLFSLKEMQYTLYDIVYNLCSEEEYHG